MDQVTRYCRDCGQDQVFDQPHPGICPDVPDGGCPELACTGCGAAVFSGLPLPRPLAAEHGAGHGAPGARGRVA